MEQSFSQRMGLKAVKNHIQVNSMDDDLRLGLWNTFVLFFRIKSKNHMFNMLLWIDFFKQLIDGYSTDSFINDIIGCYFELAWFEVYDFIEFVANKYPDEEHSKEFIKACNSLFERELAAYRFVGKRLVQVTSDQEIATIEEALEVSTQFTQHLNRALELLADRKVPDYRNSIKESISAVEAACKLVTGSQKATLGDALRQLESKLGTVHPALKEAFSKLYGYTNDAQGIRHALLGKSDLDVEDARFMLIACSAFINYLVTKAEKAGIKLS